MTSEFAAGRTADLAATSWHHVVYCVSGIRIRHLLADVPAGRRTVDPGGCGVCRHNTSYSVEFSSLRYRLLAPCSYPGAAILIRSVVSYLLNLQYSSVTSFIIFFSIPAIDRSHHPYRLSLVTLLCGLPVRLISETSERMTLPDFIMAITWSSSWTTIAPTRDPGSSTRLMALTHNRCALQTVFA